MTMLISIIASLMNANAGVNEQLAPLGLQVSRPERWAVTRSASAGRDGRTVHTVQLASSGAEIEITMLTSVKPKQAEQDAKMEFSSIMSAYKAALTPYAGSVSKNLSCAPQFAPKNIGARLMGRKVRALVGFASERKTFGACTESEAANEFLFTAVGLPGDTLLKLTAFRRREGRPQPDYWKNLLADLKLENKP